MFVYVFIDFYNNGHVVVGVSHVIACDGRAYSTPPIAAGVIDQDTGRMAVIMRPECSGHIVTHIHLYPPLIIQHDDFLHFFHRQSVRRHSPVPVYPPPVVRALVQSDRRISACSFSFTAFTAIDSNNVVAVKGCPAAVFCLKRTVDISILLPVPTVYCIERALHPPDLSVGAFSFS